MKDMSAMTSPEGEYRIFRRKAVRRAPDPQPEPVFAPPPVGPEPTHNLPAPLPEPWDQLAQVAPSLRVGGGKAMPLVNTHRDAPTAKAFDLLRSRLLQAVRSKNWSRIGVVAPTSGCGATFTAVNLALSLARVPDTRIVLMDMNQHQPGVAKALDIHGYGNMQSFLTGETEVTEFLVRMGPTLALGLVDEPDRDGAELLQGTNATLALNDMVDSLFPEVVLYDLPAALDHNDLVACLPYLDAVLIVADGTQTTAAQIAAVEDLIGDHAELLGVVLNRGRSTGA